MARSKKSSEKQAFPQQRLVESVARVDTTPGLSARELFAGMSLAGIRAAGHEFEAPLAARKAVVDADALLAELAKDGAP